MQTRTEYIKQLDEVDETLESFSRKAIDDIAGLSKAISGDRSALAGITGGVKAVRRMRATIEENCLDIMLLQQPLVADDLRRVSGTFRIVSDISHVNEMVRDAAYLIENLPDDAIAHLAEHLVYAAKKVSTMLNEAVEAFRTSDAERARKVIAMDDDVDDVYIAAEGVVIDLIKSSETRAKYLPELLMISKYFERMGDDAVRIADWAVFRVTGVHQVHKGFDAETEEASQGE